MERGHLPGVIAIERASHTNPWTERAFLHEIEENPVGRSIVALTPDEAAEVVGYAVTWVIFESLHIQNVTVRRDHRRAGIARLLLARAFDVARSRAASVALLEVRESNEAARKLYQSIGFVEDGVRKQYYSRPVEDAILYRRALEEW